MSEHDEVMAEVERLRAKNAELLQELKTTKARANESSSELAALRLELTEYKLNRPVAKVLEGVLTGRKYAAQELSDHFTFALSEADEVQMIDVATGKPVEIADGDTKRPIRLDEGEIYKYLSDLGTLGHILRGSGATGGGATGGGRSYVTTNTQPAAPKGSSFGLR